MKIRNKWLRKKKSGIRNRRLQEEHRRGTTLTAFVIALTVLTEN
jgi:hypothetical protein